MSGKAPQLDAAAASIADLAAADEASERRRTTRLLAYWRRLRAIEGVPLIVDFDPRRNPVPWDDCLLLYRAGASDWVFDHFGAGLAALTGLVPPTIAALPRDSLVARLLAELPPLLESCQPRLLAGELAASTGTLLHRSLLLPLRSLDRRLAYVLGAVTYRRR
ncbi:MAG TPA: hypothetical protein VKY65_19045 [Alphaproteobacteria bacterium]|nr:hypothetical protein [Alphaproteobacteria bacterium]